MRKHNSRVTPLILVADDERDMTDVCCLILTSAGYRVQRAYDGLTAAALAKAGKPDVAIINYQMPGMDGLGVLRELREEGLQTQVIITSGTDDFTGLTERALAAGAQAVVRQPGPAYWLLRLVPALVDRVARA